MFEMFPGSRPERYRSIVDPTDALARVIMTQTKAMTEAMKKLAELQAGLDRIEERLRRLEGARPSAPDGNTTEGQAPVVSWISYDGRTGAYTTRNE